MLNQLLDTAEYWTLGLGIAVIPLGYRAKRPDGQALKQAGYKANGAPEWQRLKAELPGEDVLRLWFAGPQRNIGIITGWQGLVVIDFDDRAGYDAWLRWAQHAGELAQTVAEVTHRVFSARGVHVYVGVDEEVQPFTVGAIDIKAAGGYVLAPPSIHPSGARYSAWSNWAPVVHVECLADVFPFEQPHDKQPPPAATGPTAGADPWAWTEHAPAGVSVHEVKRQVDILALLPGAHKTSSDGRWWMVRCPLHDDQHESMWIDAVGQRCGCMAGCTAKSMDVIDLYKRLRAVDTSAALRELAGLVPGLEGGAS